MVSRQARAGTLVEEKGNVNGQLFQPKFGKSNLCPYSGGHRFALLCHFCSVLHPEFLFL